MKKSICNGVVFVVVFQVLVLTYVSAGRRRMNPRKYKLIIKTLHNIENTTIFFDMNFEKVNLDSIFGLRAAEGILHDLIHRHMAQFKDDIKLLSEVRLMYSRIRNIGFKSFEVQKSKGEEYFKTFHHLIRQPWFYQSKQREYDKSLVRKNSLVDDINEEFSDSCMANLLTTKKKTSFVRKKSTSETKSKSACIITDDCWVAMTRKGTSGYYLTHQALFFILGDLKGCTGAFESRLHGSLDNHFNYLGSNLFFQMEAMYKQNIESMEELDLFLEQMIVCKWLGIIDCFDKEKHESLLLRMHPSGCLREAPVLTKDMRINIGVRRLQEERLLSDGCLSHATGLYIAYLAASLHWLLTEYEEPSIFKSPYFRKSSMVLFLVFIMVLVWNKCLGKCLRNCRKSFRSR